MCELVVVNDAAFDINGNGTDGPRRSNVAALHTAIATACPVFSLSAFQTGPIADIANEPLSRFITLPSPHDQVLDAQPWPMSYNYNGNISRWVGAKVAWKDSHANGYPFPGDLTVSRAIDQEMLAWSDQKTPVTLDHYAAYTVDVTLQGKSSGPHRAVFFFGHDGDRKEVIDPRDPISGPGILYHIGDVPAYSNAYLSSNVRDVPVVRDWLRSHEMPNNACGAERRVCCSHGHCGISQDDVNRDLPKPIPITVGGEK